MDEHKPEYEMPDESATKTKKIARRKKQVEKEADRKEQENEAAVKLSPNTDEAVEGSLVKSSSDEESSPE